MNNLHPTNSIWNRFGLQRLFWRIFVAFWSANLAIMIATTYVIIDGFESNQLRDNHRHTIEKVAKHIINQHESGQLYEGGHPPPTIFGPPPHGKPDTANNPPPPLLSIYNDTQHLIFGPARPRNIKRATRLTLQSESGKQYVIYSRKPHIPLFIKDTLHKLNSIQFVFILIASTLVSALLSWSITKPLKKLSRFSQQYARGALDLTVDKSLLSRKDEIGDLSLDISHMMMQIENTLSAHKQLLHDVSHELRAPLSRLQVCVALIEQKGNDSSQTKRIHAEFERINQLIQQILNYSRQDEQPDKKTHFDLIVLINKIISNISTEFPQKEFSISRDQKAVIIEAYATSLTSALENILYNACKHAHTLKAIEIDIRNLETEVVITVKDYGNGVPEQDIDKILHPFYRAGNKMHTEGFGLGLSIAVKAIEKHQGSLNVANHSAGGLIVTCHLPLPQREGAA